MLNGLTRSDLEDLTEDIKVYQQIHRNAGSYDNEYWSDLTIIVDEELRRLRQRDPEAAHDSRGRGIHASVIKEVANVFVKKSTNELAKIRLLIEEKLKKKNAPGVDVPYYESLLSQLKAQEARARLRETHRKNLEAKLELLKAQQGVTLKKPEEA